MLPNRCLKKVWAGLGGLWCVLGTVLAVFETPWARFGVFWGRLEVSWAVLEPSLGGLRAVVAACRGCCGAFSSVPMRPKALLGGVDVDFHANMKHSILDVILH